MQILIPIVVLFIITNKIEAQHPNGTSTLHDAEELFDDGMTVVKSIQQKLFKWGAQHIGDPCVMDLMEVFIGFTKGEIWALKLLDASSKLQSGILDANIVNMGSYDECIKIGSPTNKIRGKYCLAIMDISGSLAENLQDSIKWDNLDFGQSDIFFLLGSVCVPHRCSKENITSIINVLKDDPREKTGSYQLMPKHECETEHEQHLRFWDWMFLCFILGLLTFIGISTTRDLKFSDSGPVVKAFSLYTNTQKLFATDTSTKSTVTCLNGIRVLSINYVVLGHRALMTGIFPIFINNTVVYEKIRTLPGQLILGANYAVDTFLVISGFLVATGVLRQLDKRNGNIPWHIFYLHRYIRLVPALLIIILFLITVVVHLNDGPLWKFVVQHGIVDNCVNHWWTALTFTENYISPTERCVDVSWYLSVDMQLYLISPILLLVLWRYKKLGYATLVAALVILHIIAFKVVWDYKIKADVFIQTSPNDNKAVTTWKKYYYQQTHTRAAPWFLGVLLAFYMYHTGVDRKLNRVFVSFMWILTFILQLGTVLLSYPFVQTDSVYNQLQETTYIVFSRTAWSIGNCWIIYACHLGYGGVLNWFLSLKMWTPLSRISYSLYLIHTIVQLINFGQIQTTLHFSRTYLLYSYIGDMVLAIVMATLIHLCIECPVFGLEDYLMKRSVENGQRRVAPITQPNCFKKLDIN